MDEELKKLQTAVEEKIKMAASKEELEKIKSEMKTQIDAIKVGVSDEELKAAKDEFDSKLKAQWDEVEKKLTVIPKSEPMTFGEQLKHAFEKAGYVTKANEDGVEFDSLKLPKDSGEKIRVKLAVDMNTANTTASVATGLQTNYGMMMQKLPSSNEARLLDIFPHMPLAAIERYMAKVVEYTEVDGSGQKAETSAAGDSSFLIKTEDYKVFGFGVKFRVHRNMLRTWLGLQQRVTTVGMERLANKIDQFILDKAAGGDGSTVPYGMLSTAKYTAYDTALRAGEVSNANIVDVIKNGVLQEQLLGTSYEVSNKSVDSILLNHVDIANIESLKDANDNSVKLAGIVVDATGKLSYIYGLRVIAKKNVTANTFVLFNSTTNPSIEIGDKFNMEVIVGYDKTDDLSKGIVTIQIENEMAIGLGDPETIIYCSNITAAAVALNAV